MFKVSHVSASSLLSSIVRSYPYRLTSFNRCTSTLMSFAYRYTATGWIIKNTFTSSNSEKLSGKESHIISQIEQVSKELHSSLYNIIKDYYTPAGVTPATDKFYLPDLKGRAVMGFCNYKTPYKLTDAKAFKDGVKLGEPDGYFSHKLNEDEIPSHNHGVFEHAHLILIILK